MAVGGEDGHLKIFSLESSNGFDRFQQNRVMRRDAMPPRKAHDTSITAMAIDEALQLAVSGDASGLIKLWRGGGSRTILFPTGGQTVSHLSSVPGERSLFAASDDQIYHWTFVEDEAIPGPLNQTVLDQEITAIAVSRDASTIAVADVTGRVTTLPLDSDSEIEQVVLRR